MSKRVFEITASGFSGGGYGMNDERVLWVRASNLDQVESAIAGLGATCWGVIKPSAMAGPDVDFTLPQDEEALVERLRQLAPKEPKHGCGHMQGRGAA